MAPSRKVSRAPPPQAFSIRHRRPVRRHESYADVLEEKRTPNPSELCYQRLTQSIDQAMLLSALEEMSQYINKHGCHIRLVALEGLVDTLFLRSWTSMKHCFIISWHLPEPLLGLLKEARASVVDRSPFLMDTQWFNFEKTSYMDEKTAQELTAEAFRQDDVVYSGVGMKIYAAPWEYAFTVKSSRLFTKGALNPRAYYDLYDAVQYMRRCIRKGTRQQIGLDTVETWAEAFDLQIETNILTGIINDEYVRQFGVGAFCYSRKEAADATRWDSLTLQRKEHLGSDTEEHSEQGNSSVRAIGQSTT